MMSETLPSSPSQGHSVPSGMVIDSDDTLHDQPSDLHGHEEFWPVEEIDILDVIRLLHALDEACIEVL